MRSPLDVSCRNQNMTPERHIPKQDEKYTSQFAKCCSNLSPFPPTFISLIQPFNLQSPRGLCNMLIHPWILSHIITVAGNNHLVAGKGRRNTWVVRPDLSEWYMIFPFQLARWCPPFCTVSSLSLAAVRFSKKLSWRKTCQDNFFEVATWKSCCWCGSCCCWCWCCCTKCYTIYTTSLQEEKKDKKSMGNH